MKVNIIIGFLIIFNVSLLYSQQDRKLVREGVKEYNEKKYGDAEISFRKAFDKNKNSYPAEYNIANSIYKQNKYKESAEKYESLQQKEPDAEKLADVYHNLGNSFLKSQQYDKSIEAYKNSLRLRPDDNDTRYNLAYALSKLKQQQQQNQKSDKDQNKNDNKDQQNKKNQDQQKDQNNKDEKENQKEPQTQQNELTKREAEQLLEAIQNQEKQVQEKIDKEKAKSAKVSNDKDW